MQAQVQGGRLAGWRPRLHHANERAVCCASRPIHPGWPAPPLPSPRAQVRCANRPVVQPREHAEVQAEMRASRFCLMLPGDNVSSGRLTEAILAGCIPVVRGRGGGA
jgi:hypothetical protein